MGFGAPRTHPSPPTGFRPVPQGLSYAGPRFSQSGGLGFDSMNANPLELLSMGERRASNVVAESLSGGDGVTRRKRSGFHRQTETYYGEARGSGRIQPTRMERDNAEEDSRTSGGLRHPPVANPPPGAAAGKGSLLDRASASLGLRSVSMDPVSGYAGPRPQSNNIWLR